MAPEKDIFHDLQMRHGARIRGLRPPVEDDEPLRRIDAMALGGGNGFWAWNGASRTLVIASEMPEGPVYDDSTRVLTF